MSEPWATRLRGDVQQFRQIPAFVAGLATGERPGKSKPRTSLADNIGLAPDGIRREACYELRTVSREAAFMRQNSFGKLPPVSALTLGGGGIGMVWGETTFDECVASVHAAVAAGINLIDLAPRYGDGKAEQVVGEAFAGRLPDGVRVTSKCNLGNPSPEEIEPLLSPFECGARREPYRAVARCRQPHDALCDLCRACPPGLRAVGWRGYDRCLGSDGHRPSRHDRQTARRAPSPGGRAVHRQLAGLTWRAEVFRRTREAPRRHDSSARERGVRDGYPRGAGGR